MSTKFFYLMLLCTFEASNIAKTLSSTYTKPYPRQSPLHLTLYPNGKINHAFIMSKNNTRQVMVAENSLKIFVQAKDHTGTLSATVNLANMVEDTHSCDINLEQNLH